MFGKGRLIRVAQQWMMEFLIGLGKMFSHPIFYFAFFACIFMGYLRVKRERKDFNIRAQNGYFELRNLLPAGLVMGGILSILTVALGITVPFAAIILAEALTFLILLTLKFRLLSPVYTLGLTFFIIFFTYDQHIEVPIFSSAFKNLEPIYPSIPFLMGLLLVVEGLLISKNAYKGTSPKMITSKRGLPAGVHVSRRLWMVPFFVFLPTGELSSPFEWWPVLQGPGSSQFTPVVIPFLIGFSQQVQGLLPKESIKMNGNRVIALGVIVTLVAMGGYWYPLLSIAAVALGLLGRESITFYQRLFEERLPFYFSYRDRGVMILGIIPNSPAEKMGLEIGEIVTKVNGVPVNNKKQFYEALMKNRAHCKLEVLDSNDQIRFVQRALFEGEHHELGILFVQQQKRGKQEAV